MYRSETERDTVSHRSKEKKDGAGKKQFEGNAAGRE